MRKYPKEWYEHGVNPFPRLLEHWYQQYVKAHPEEFGLTNLEGPFDTGPDFKGVLGGAMVSIEVERGYKSYRDHGHQDIDVLIVGVIEPPLPTMKRFLPPIVMNLDPQKVMDWSQPTRHEHRVEMDKRREQRAQDQDMEWLEKHRRCIKAYRFTKDERLQVEFREQEWCACGGLAFETAYNLELDGEMTEGQQTNYDAGFWKIFQCPLCDARGWVERA